MAKEEVYELRIAKNTGFFINETGVFEPKKEKD